MKTTSLEMLPKQASNVEKEISNWIVFESVTWKLQLCIICIKTSSESLSQ